MLDNLQIAKYRFTLKALEEIRLHKYKGSTLRGGFGSVFKRAVCFHGRKLKQNCSSCLLRENCPYVYIFETPPPPDTEIVDKLSDAPRPYVIEPPLEEKTLYQLGEEFQFYLILIGRAINHLPFFIVVFRELGRIGLGRERGKYRLKSVEAIHPLTRKAELIYEGDTGLVSDEDLSIGYPEVEESARNLPKERISLLFLTPTRLKYKGKFVTEPPFHVVFRSALRRISWLYYFHCGDRWEVDYPGLVEAAEKVETKLMETTWVELERFSFHQRRRIKMSGFIGLAEYEGDLSPFLPIILLGSLVHIGKLCTFGLGKYEILKTPNFGCLN
jgi:hypothetical protein